MNVLKNHKEHLKTLGWSYRAAAPILGITYQHLCLVLCGHRTSQRLLAKIRTMPARKQTEAQ
jgi:hypothetical protein